MQSKENISEMVYLVLVQHTFNLGFHESTLHYYVHKYCKVITNL